MDKFPSPNEEKLALEDLARQLENLRDAYLTLSEAFQDWLMELENNDQSPVELATKEVLKKYFK